MPLRNFNGHTKEFLRNQLANWARALKNVRQSCCRQLEENERRLGLWESRRPGGTRVSTNRERILLFVGVDDRGEVGDVIALVSGAQVVTK